MILRPNAHGRIKWMAVFAIYFLFILAPRFQVGVGVHAGLLALVAMLFLAHVYLGAAAADARIWRAAAFLVMLAAYHIVMALFYGNTFTEFSAICFSAITYLLFGYLLTFYLTDSLIAKPDPIHAIALLYVGVMFVNSVTIILEYSIPPLKAALESIQDAGSNISYADHPFRNRGLAAGGGAGLSVANAMAIWACVSLWRRDLVSSNTCLLITSALAASNIFTGRTGLLLGLLAVGVFMLMLGRRAITARAISVKSLVGVAFVIGALIIAGSQITLSDEVIGWAFEWAGDWASGDSALDTSSTDDLRSMLFFPTDALHLLLGVGFFEGVGKIYPRSDSGYLKTLLSIGLPLSLVLYGWIYHSLLQVARMASGLRFFMIPMLFALAFTEIKEPFIYQSASGRFLFTLMGACIAMQALRKVPDEPAVDQSFSAPGMLKSPNLS